MLGRALSFAVWLATQATAVPGSVTPSGGWLQWSASATGEACGEPTDFAARVQAVLGRPPGAAAANLGVSIAVHVDRLTGEARPWRGELRTQGRDGTWTGARRIERAGESCEPVLATLALMTTLVLEPAGREPPPPAPLQTAPETPARPVAATAMVQTDTPFVEDRPARPAPWALAIAAGPGAEAGLLPGVALEAGATLTVRPSGGAGVFASALISTSATAYVAAGQGATLSRAALGLGGCSRELARRSHVLELCIGGELARVHAAGIGFDLTAVQERWALAITAGANLRQQIAGPLFAAAGVRLLIPFERDRIAYTDPTGQTVPIFRAGPVGGSAQLLMGVTFR